MELIASIPLIGGLLATVIPFVIVLGIVVFIHEYGHYIVGRWSGIHAEVFSIGYGRPIWSGYDKRGTKWQIAWLPLGGYVKFLGDANAASFGDADDAANVAPEDRNRAFPTASVGARAATVAAGPIFNFILSAVIFTGVILYVGRPSEVPTVGELRIPIEAPFDLRVNDQILAVNGAEISSFGEFGEALDQMPIKGPIDLTISRGGDVMEVTAPYLFPPLVRDTTLFSPASKAGLKKGDIILSIEGQDLVSFSDLKAAVLASGENEIEMVYLRDGEEITTKLSPEYTEMPKESGGFEQKVMIGVRGSLAIEPLMESVEFFPTVWRGTKQVWSVITASLDGMRHMVRGAFGAEDGLSAKNLQGPLGIAQVSGGMAQKGLLEYIELIALLSTAIGMLNLFPIPILDGGHLMIFAYEAVVGKQPSDKVLNMAMSIGFVLLMSLMLFASYNDIVRLIT